MLEPGRPYTASSASNYRYGFNGKEQDSTFTSQDYDYGFRIYDARVVRFLSVDPLASKFPYFTPYQYAGGNPIAATDLDGKEFDWLTWKIIFWLSKSKIQGTNAGNTFVKNLNTVATSNNMGHFTSNDPVSLQQQVDDNNLKTFQAKAEVYKTVADVTKYSTVGFVTPFVITAAAPVLPELFTIAGTSNLDAAGSYLVQHTVSALIDAGAQKLVTGKVDL